VNINILRHLSRLAHESSSTFFPRGRRWQWLAIGVLSAAALSAAATEGRVTLEFSTVAARGKYSPKHVLAVWVTDANTNFVKTVCRYASKRQKYLSTWQGARGSDSAVDGVSGATRNRHEALAVTWDGCAPDKKPLPDGNYLLFVEFTDAHQQGPKATFPIAKGAKAVSQSFPDQEYFKTIKLTYSPVGQ
jgi:hypothetical protein